MKTITENLKLRTATYPQLSRLPKGVRLIIQDGHEFKRGIKKYCSVLKNGIVILVGAGNSIKEARVNSLIELNRKLKQENLVWGNNCKMKTYLKAIS